MIVRLFSFKQIRALKTQHTPRTAVDALAAGQAMAGFNRLPFPGMAADINLNGTVIGTNPALHTTGRIRDNKTRHESLAAGRIVL